MTCQTCNAFISITEKIEGTHVCKLHVSGAVRIPRNAAEAAIIHADLDPDHVLFAVWLKQHGRIGEVVS